MGVRWVPRVDMQGDCLWQRGFYKTISRVCSGGMSAFKAASFGSKRVSKLGAEVVTAHRQLHKIPFGLVCSRLHRALARRVANVQRMGARQPSP